MILAPPGTTGTKRIPLGEALKEANKNAPTKYRGTHRTRHTIDTKIALSIKAKAAWERRRANG